MTLIKNCEVFDNSQIAINCDQVPKCSNKMPRGEQFIAQTRKFNQTFCLQNQGEHFRGQYFTIMHILARNNWINTDV